MFEKVVAWFALILNKKVCDADTLSQSCIKLVAYCEQDKDGKITIGEIIWMLLKLIREK